VLAAAADPDLPGRPSIMKIQILLVIWTRADNTSAKACVGVRACRIYFGLAEHITPRGILALVPASSIALTPVDKRIGSRFEE